VTRLQDLPNQSAHATARAVLPALNEPRNLDEALEFCRSARQHLLTRQGVRNVYERAATMRDLENLGRTLGVSLHAGTANPTAATFKVVGQGDSGFSAFEDFAQRLTSTNLYKDLLKRIDDPTRFDRLPLEVQQQLLVPLNQIAQERGADIRRFEQKIQDLQRSYASNSVEVTAAFNHNTAAVRDIQFAYANNTRAVAGAVTQVNARLDDFDGGGASVEVTMEAIADRATGLEAQYTVKVSAGGAMAGFGLAAVSPIAGPATSYMIFVADNFAFVKPDDVIGTGMGEIDPTSPGTGRIPFGIDSDDVIYLNGIVRIDANGPELGDLPLLSTSYWLTSSAPAIVRDTTNAYTPSTITFGGMNAVGTTGPAAYAGRFIIATTNDGTAFTTRYTSAANESSKTYTPPAGVVGVRCRMYEAGGTTTLLDETLVPVVDAGSNAITVVVTNPSQSVFANNSGVVSSYSNTGTTIQVYEGATLLTFTTGSIGDSKFTCGTPVVVPTGKITVGARSGNGTTTLTVADHSAMDNATDSVQITYPLTIQKADGSSVSWSPKQIITKSKTGAAGSAGAAGTRGSFNGNGFQYGIRTSAWSDTLAQRVIENMNTGTALTTGIAVGSMTAPGLVLGDSVTLGDGNPWWATQGAYSAVTAYTPNQIVISSGVAYRALQASTNKTPASNPLYWLSLGAINATGAWSAIHTYSQNDTATSGGTTYLAKWTHTSDASALANDLATAEVAQTRYWGGAAWLMPGVFIDGNLFVTGTVSGSVLYGGTIIGVGIALGPSAEFQVDGTTGSVTASSFVGYASVFGNTLNATLNCITATTFAGGSGDAIRALVDYNGGTASTGCAITAISESASALSHAIRGTWNKFGTSADPGRAVNNGVYSSGIVGANNGNAFYAESGTVGPFTGSHEVAIPNGMEFDAGDIGVDVSCLLRNGYSNTLFLVERSSSAFQRGVMGALVYTCAPMNKTALLASVQGVLTVDEESGVVSGPEEFEAVKNTYTIAQANALGEGQINVCGEGGDIAMGDYICASSIPGKGMRQPSFVLTLPGGSTMELQVMCDITVAKAREPMTFSGPTDVKTIACSYHPC
jgi:hypothetical protein